MQDLYNIASSSVIPKSRSRQRQKSQKINPTMNNHEFDLPMRSIEVQIDKHLVDKS